MYHNILGRRTVLLTVILQSLLIAGTSEAKDKRCQIKLDVKASRIGVDSLDFEWSIPDSCDSKGAIVETNLRFSTCSDRGHFDFKSAIPVFSTAAYEEDPDAGAFGRINEPRGTTLTNLLPATKYCFGFFIENFSRETFGPFFGSAKTRPDVPTVLTSKASVSQRPELEMRYHIRDLDLQLVEVSSSTPFVGEYVNLVAKMFSAKLISRLYSTDSCGHLLDPPGSVAMSYDPAALRELGLRPEQLFIFESEPTDIVATKLERRRIDLENHLITGEVSVLNCPNFRPIGVKGLQFNFGLFAILSRD